MNVSDADDRAAAITRPEKPFALLRWGVTAALLVGLAGSVAGIDSNWGRLVELPERLWTLVGLMFVPPDLSWLPRAMAAMWESIAIAWIGTLIGAVLSFPLAFLASSNLAGRLSVGIVRQVLNVFRAIPEIIFAILFIPVLGLTPVTGALAIGISSVGTIGKLVAEVIESIDPGPVEAADAVGASRAERIRWGVIPQIMPEVVALWLYRFEINVRAGAVLGLIGAGGIGGLLDSQLRIGRQWAAAGTSIIVIVLATMLIDAVSGRLRRRIIRGPDRPVEDDAATPTTAATV